MDEDRDRGLNWQECKKTIALTSPITEVFIIYTASMSSRLVRHSWLRVTKAQILQFVLGHEIPAKRIRRVR